MASQRPDNKTREVKMGHKLKQPKVIDNRTDFFYYAFRNILLASVPLLIISAFVLSSITSSVKADGRNTDSFTITIPTTCTIDATIATGQEHNATLNSGTAKSDIGTTKMAAYCNDINGYYIYAIGYGNNTDGNTNMVSSLGNDFDIATGTAMSGDTSNWAMKITGGTGTTAPYVVGEYRNYTIVPSQYDVIAYRESNTSMDKSALDTSGSYIETTYQAYATPIQPAGTYTGQVKYTLIHPFDATKLVSIDTAFRIAQKDRYILKTNGTWIIETDPSAESIPESEIAGRYFAMQDMSSTVCKAVTTRGKYSASQLIDIRDGNLYWAAKLDDDNCWMTQNLDLSIGGTGVAALNSNNTDISTNPEVYASSGIYSDYNVSDGVYTWNPDATAVTSGRAITYPNNSNNPTVSNWTNDNSEPYSAEGGDTYYYTSDSDANDSRYTTLADCKNLGGHTEAECKRYFAGNYYNWTAAVASNGSSNISTNNSRATNSICPKNWRLPNAARSDNEYNEFGRLFYKADITTSLANGNNSVSYKDGTKGFNKLRSDPYFFVRSGNIYIDTLYDSGVDGRYWSSTVSNGSYAYYLYFLSSGLWPASLRYGRELGWSVRCVAR